jgi:hypothetical protein
MQMNYSPWAHPHNGKRTDIFSMEDSLMIMASYQNFLLFVFATVAKTHLCSQAVQNQVMALYGGKTAFQEYVKAHPDKFFSALKDSFQTCCHPEFLLNERYRNEHFERYAKLWDEIYSEIRSYFGNPDKCTEANNIITGLEGSVSFELLKKAAKEKNARTSKRLSDLAERGEHPWQQPEFIEAHSERTSERMRALVEKGEHLFQQPEFIEENSECKSKRARALVEKGEHHLQQPEFIQANCERVRKGIHNKRKLSSGSTEEATYYAIDGADENGRFILIREIFGTKDLNFRKSVLKRNGKKATRQFHTLVAINEFYLRKCSTKTCTNWKMCSKMICKACFVSR